MSSGAAIAFKGVISNSVIITTVVLKDYTDHFKMLVAIQETLTPKSKFPFRFWFWPFLDGVLLLPQLTFITSIIPLNIIATQILC